MEDFPAALPEGKPNNNPDKKKKSRDKGAKFRLPAQISLENKQKDKTPKHEPSRVDEIIAKLTINRQQPENTAKDKLPKEAKGPASEDADGPQATDAEPADDKPRLENRTGKLEPKPEDTPDASGAETVFDRSHTQQKDESRSADSTAEAVAEPDDNAETEPEAFEEQLLPERPLNADANELSGGEVIYINSKKPEIEPVEHHEDGAAEVPIEAAVPLPAEPQSVEAPIFTRQQEQQHQAREIPGPEASEPLADGGGEKPPEVAPPLLFEQLPKSPPPPEVMTPPVEVLQPAQEDVYPSAAAEVPYTTGSAGSRPAAGEQPATKQEVEDAIYLASKAAQNRGLVTGLVVGGWYEHRKHKKRERKAEKRFKKQAKDLQSARQDYNYGLQKAASRQAASERRFNGLEMQLSQAKHNSRPESAQRSPQNRGPEALRGNENLPAIVPERLPIESPEQLPIPADHRLEQSAWHTIEVDAKTGKPVENPAFQYGHEYYRERAQENMPATQRNAAAGEAALAAAASGASAGSSADSNTSSAPSAVSIPDASTQGPPGSGSQQPKKSSQQPDSGSGSPIEAGPLWPWLVALGVIVVILLALFH